MSVIFKGVEMPAACCFVDKEQIEYCKFYSICKKRDTIKTNHKPSDCPVKALDQEPTTKNNLAHNLCDSCTNIGCEFQSGIVRTECAFYMPPHIETDNCGNYVVQEPTIKALGEELRKARKGIADEKVLIGYNMAVAICNKYLGESEE